MAGAGGAALLPTQGARDLGAGLGQQRIRWSTEIGSQKAQQPVGGRPEENRDGIHGASHREKRNKVRETTNEYGFAKRMACRCREDQDEP